MSPVPPLEAGDRLERAEFERRYAAMPHLKKAELIGGVVYVQQAVGHGHGRAHAHAMGWLYHYEVATPGVEVCDNATVRLDLDNEPQPDACLRVAPERGGQSRTAGGFVEGAPELAFEVAASSASYDLHDKLDAYRRSGVREYVVWRTRDAAIDWFVARAGAYVRLDADAEGILASEVFPGLWLDPEALARRDGSRVLAVLQRGLASPAHAEFVRELERRGGAA